ncbi:MAG: Ppx/GppA family phosphatase [Hyphomicrobiaceae bacterium]|nr:Ppx/GppA family phosphatase [Hyphomicrobiaceae bacterium]
MNRPFESVARWQPPLLSGKVERPVAVLDIGSNSVRLVVYEKLSRALTPIYNEKVACTLGRGVAETGRIADENAGMAYAAFARFSKVAAHLGVEDLHIIATSAVRDASNGGEFMTTLAALMGRQGRVLSGEEEAHFAALGVISGMPGFAGLVGDLGGGSLELARIDHGHDLVGETLGLGVIRLQDDSGGKPARALDIARERIGAASSFAGRPQGKFAAIGGTWRSLAKLAQFKSGYPLHMVQGYSIEPAVLLDVCHDLVNDKISDTLMDMIGSSRRGVLAYGAAAMAAVIELGQFNEVCFSALGVREGYLYNLLDDAQKVLNPLIEAVHLFNEIRSRAPALAEELCDFTSRFLSATRLRETEDERTLRRAACFLADIGWRGHPDYRGEQSVDLVAFSAMTGIDHAGRAFLADVLAVRYMGLKHESQATKLAKLVGDEGLKRARQLGAMLRVAFCASAAIPGILPSVQFEISEAGLSVLFPNDKCIFDAMKMDSRLKNVANLVDQTITYRMV